MQVHQPGSLLIILYRESPARDIIQYFVVLAGQAGFKSRYQWFQAGDGHFIPGNIFFIHLLQLVSFRGKGRPAYFPMAAFT
jgi:hypothetical protein